MAAIGGVMIWQGNQDAAPFTNRKRFILVNRGEILFYAKNVARVQRRYRQCFSLKLLRANVLEQFIIFTAPKQ